MKNMLNGYKELIHTYNWEITEHSENTPLAQYHKTAKLKVTIKESVITFEQIQNGTRFKRKMVKIIKNGGHQKPHSIFA